MLDQIGITIRVSEIPEYVEYARLRDRLELMHPIRRWLSFRLRRELAAREHIAAMALITASIVEATNALD